MRLCQLVVNLDLSRSILYNTCQQPFATAYYPLLSRHIFKRSYATIFLPLCAPRACPGMKTTVLLMQEEQLPGLLHGRTADHLWR